MELYLRCSLHSILDVNREFQNNDERAEALSQVTTYEPYKIAMDCANDILKRTGFRKGYPLPLRYRLVYMGGHA